MIDRPDETRRTKAEWREALTAQRSALSEAGREAASTAIRERVLQLPDVRSARTVLAYASVAPEVETYRLIEALLAADRGVSLPVIGAGHAMDAYRIHALSDLTPDRFGILAPTEARRTEDDRVEWPGVVLVPGLGFDATSGHRLGRGSGYYDRYLAERPDTVAVGLAFDEQVVSALPFDGHDVPMGVLVTPTRTIRFAG